MSGLYIGWDVGAWNCDRNQLSRDGLCALELADGALRVAGRAWHGNTREALNAAENDLMGRILDLLEVPAPRPREITIALDTPLGWPQAALNLLTGKATVEVPEKVADNPYHYRRQERDLYGAGSRPLSVVRDMLGSQSTKGVHFLARAGLRRRTVGVWKAQRRPITAIETYPAVALLRDPGIKPVSADLFASAAGAERRRLTHSWKRDVGDAIICALMAHRYATRPDTLAHPPADAIAEEGWIWLPTPSLLSSNARRPQRR